ncbi:histidine kinase [Actinoplanes utahensis]|uniref:Histidine kinase n=2 Tax=Actinoplanes utahensis TaxID=1869 RepID=A0A0A6UCK3_ACTUT|nr:histidine kinase [Actinoplanes utahensis]KHD74778.1 histidine kinase [Actinoplanes utahensis]
MDYPELRDRQRLRDLARIGVDRPAERPYLTEIVEAAAERIETPFAVVTVLLNGAQVFLAGRGPIPAWIGEAGGTPIEWAFCLPMLHTRAAWHVNDFTEDPRFRTNPLVTVEGVRSYIAAPLITSDGLVLGGLCALDVRPRDFAPGQLGELQSLADEAVRRIEADAEPDIMMP